jgi:hypothetical protein
MRRTLFAAVALAVGCVVPTSASALTPSVSSHTIGPRERPVISFVADRRTAGNFWYEVHVRAVRPSDGCEIYEEVTVSYTFPGQMIAVKLKPWETGRWCKGRWRGRVFLAHSASCNEGVDEYQGGCFVYAPPAGRFWFRVAD